MFWLLLAGNSGPGRRFLALVQPAAAFVWHSYDVYDTCLFRCGLTPVSHLLEVWTYYSIIQPVLRQVDAYFAVFSFRAVRADKKRFQTLSPESAYFLPVFGAGFRGLDRVTAICIVSKSTLFDTFLNHIYITTIRPKLQGFF